MGNKVLGKGLSALIPENKGLDVQEGIKFLNVLSIQDNSLQPRTDYDEASLEELKASIKEKGVLQPILVRLKNGQYEVVAGERRLRAVRALGIKEVPVVVKELTDQETLVVALVENIQREDLNPIEEAEAFRRLIEEFHYTQEKVAQSVGKDRTTVSNLLRLLKLPKIVQEYVYSNKISMGHARALLGVEGEKNVVSLANLIIEKNLSVREVEDIVRKGKESSFSQKKNVSVKGHEILALEEDLQKVLGTKVNVHAKNKKGKLVIEYYSLEDLDRIVGLIKK